MEKFSVIDKAAPFKAFYDAKISGNGHLLSIYTHKVPTHVKDGFFNDSKAHYANLRTFIAETLPRYLPESGFIGGQRPGEDDFHVGAWLARIAATLGGTTDKDGVQVLEKQVDGPVPPKVISYWAAWAERESWKSTYSDGLH